MKFGAVDIPQGLINALRSDNLVVFAGAGVSMGEPARLPDFKKLAVLVSAGTGEFLQDKEPEDRFLGRLQHNKVDVHARAAKELSRDGLLPTELHRNLLRLFPSIKHVRVITTNFDLLFERAAEDEFGGTPEIYKAPALPLGRNFRGIVHVHGVVNRQEEMIMTDADFGRAYLTEGWARRFLIEVFRHFTVLFVGYSHNDVVMHYLSRALPEREVGHRFVLTYESDDLQRWQVLGIEPITYHRPKEDDYSVLYEGIYHLADAVKRNILDWRREMTELASKLPPVDSEDDGMIALALQDVATTRFFTEHARLPEWIKWLNSRKYLDALFSEQLLSERDNVLAAWLAEKFAYQYSSDLFLLIAEHGMRVNRDFWWTLGRVIASENQALDEPTLSKWVSILLATVPPWSDKYLLLSLGERCAKLGALTSLLQIFDTMSAYRINLKPKVIWPDQEATNKQPAIDIELQFISQYHVLNKFWEKLLKPELVHVAAPLLALTIRRLEEHRSALRVWQMANREFDFTSQLRPAIEPHDQNKFPKAIDAVIDAARDSLAWLVREQPAVADGWCNRLAVSEVPLLRRLAVHTVADRNDLSADDKIHWLLEHYELYDRNSLHEIHRAVKIAYAEASPACRRAVIKAVLAYESSDKQDVEHERHTANKQFQWLHWIHSAAAECEFAKSALESIQAKYPEFIPSKHPDLVRWIGAGWIGPQSPWTMEELLERSAQKWFPDLLTFKGDRFLGPDRHGLLNTVVDAIKNSFDWGLDLATTLCEKKHWDCDLWSALIRAWSAMEMNEVEHRAVLDWLKRTELHRDHSFAIADALYFLVKDNGRPYAQHLLPQANAIAASLWEGLDRSEIPKNCDDWFQMAIGNPAGTLSQFWLGSLSLWLKGQDPKPKILTGEYKQAFTDIIKDESIVGKLGHSVLASQLDFLLSVDEAWTRSYLLPFFYPEAERFDFQAAWDGFLSRGHLNSEVAGVLEGAFLKAVTKLGSAFVHRQERFIEYYTTFLAYYAADPFESWIPSLFKYGDKSTRILFASQIEYHLRIMDEMQHLEWWNRWLKKYWENRIHGVRLR